MSNKRQIILSSIFVAIEMVLFVLIFTISGPANKWISFSCILLCFLFSLTLISLSKTKILTQIGLLTTVLADVFLVILGEHQVVAMSFFSITQIAYFLRIFLNTDSKKERVVHIAIRMLAIVGTIIATILVLGEKLDALSFISMFYYVNLILNVVFSFVQIKKSILFPIGLLCFAICDLFIGLQVAIGTYISVPESSFIYKVVFSSFNWAWFFYVPAQVLIVLSLVFSGAKRKKTKTGDWSTLKSTN